MTTPLKQQLAEDLTKVKEQSGDRAQRIKTILKTALADAMAEVKGGAQEVKLTSKASLNKVVQSANTVDPAKSTVTVAATESLEEASAELVQSEVAPEATSSADPSVISDLQSLLKSAGLKTKDMTREQYDKLQAELPEYLDQAKGKTAAWDQQLSDRYGDRYASLKQRFEKALAWYKAKLAEGRAVEAKAEAGGQTKTSQELSDLGAKVAQKEEAIKQQIGQTLRTVTVDAKS